MLFKSKKISPRNVRICTACMSSKSFDIPKVSFRFKKEEKHEKIEIDLRKKNDYRKKSLF